jgi:hypothetical protein
MEIAHKFCFHHIVADQYVIDSNHKLCFGKGNCGFEDLGI